MKKSKEIVKKTKRLCIETTFAYPLVIKSGYGCYIEDINGKLYLDFNSNVCSCAVGYNHPEIINVIRKFTGVGAHKIAGQDFYSKEQVELAEELIRITPRKLNRVLLVNTGAEAVENAIKFAFRKKGPLPGVSCTNAFHGRTLGALTFTDSKAVQKKNYPEINHDIIKFCTRDNDFEVNGLQELIEREWVPAFVIVECIQGEGGYNVASKKFIKNLRKTSKKYDFPLIIDEIQSGLGRTGKWWSFEHYGIRPDIITSAKSLQVGALICSKKYDPKEPGSVSSTWGGGHRIDLAVGLKTIEIIKHEKLLDNARKIGNYMLKRLRGMKRKYPKIIDVRGLGLMIGVEFSKEIYKDIIPKIAFKKGLLLLGCGKKTIRITPPLIITKQEADKGLKIFEDVIKHLKR
ncbi:MAG: aminotransferase class III-fold pyridoxal phosphate-dependent enzyme [Candidatus Aenigmarchaeota archaeon]|nr:aminotransferase class III-fold pyridoxal phosphate-dependent enzyme [Candidatus Aenigmarchaeota archaeon]